MNRFISSLILGIVLVVILLIVGYLLFFPFVYDSTYFEKVGIKGSHYYKDIILTKGAPIKTEEEKKGFIAYYDGLNFIFTKREKILIRAEIIGIQYRFGLRSIGVGSTRKQIESAYKNVKKMVDLPANEFGAIDNGVWVNFVFDSDNMVKKILIYYGP